MAGVQLTRLLQLAASEALPGAAAKQTACLTSALSWRRQFSSSTASAAPAPAVQGDAAGVLKGIEGVVSSPDVSAKDVADAALSLAYLHAKSDRRVWGRVFEAATAQSSSFDASSLAAFLWAATTANVGHFKTLYDLAGPAAKLLPGATPSQQAIIVEALGKAGVNDADVFKAAAAAVAKSSASYSVSDLSKLLWGAAAAKVTEPGLVKAAAAALTSKAGEASTKDLAQAAWALAKMGKGDAAVLDAVSKALSSKVGADTAPQDAVASLWAFATLNKKPDQQALSKLAAVVKGAAGELSTEQAVYAAWGLAVLQQFDKEALGALFGAIGNSVAAAPDAVPIKVLGALCEAQALTLDRMGAQAPRLPDQVFNYSMDMFRLGLEAAKTRSGGAGASFRKGLAAAAARAGGARYKPEVAVAVSKMSVVTPDGLPVDIALQLDDKTKVALLPVEQGWSAGQAEVMKRLYEARGFKAVPISRAAFEAQEGEAAQARFVLDQMKGAIGGKYDALSKKLAEPFNPYE